MSRYGLLLLLAVACVPACGPKRPPVSSVPVSEPAPGALTPEPAGGLEEGGEEDLLPVRKVPEPIIVAAWAEPKALAPGGGQAQLLVRVQKKGGAAYPGVEVRFRTSSGMLYSQGAILVTDASGRTRDRLTTRETAIVTLNAGGTRYRFRVPVGEEPEP
jgi:hypothetical protein